MLTGSCHPGGDGSMPISKDPHRGRDVQAFSQCRQHLSYALSGSLEPVERGVAAGAEGRATRLAAERLNAVTRSMFPIADHGMDLCVRNLVVCAVAVRAAEALGRNTLGRAAAAFPLVPGLNG